MPVHSSGVANVVDALPQSGVGDIVEERAVLSEEGARIGFEAVVGHVDFEVGGQGGCGFEEVGDCV
ncbi:MAG: hypothetical protein CMB77_07740 [Euryarchaeota archaeon]|nr:hypothetical protein [Euryarchaeota archaeon]